MTGLYGLMPITAAFSSSIRREKVLIGASQFFAMMKEQYSLSLVNWNLRYATAPYVFSEASQNTCSSIPEAL